MMRSLHIRSPRKPRVGAAFTLVEVLATMAFASILLPTVVQGISLCLSTAGLARQEAQASALAHSKLSELLATGDYLSGSISGDFGTDWPEFRWQAQLTNWDNVLLNQFQVTVSWKARGVDREVSVSTLVYLYQNYQGTGPAYYGSGNLLPGGTGQPVTGGTP